MSSSSIKLHDPGAAVSLAAAMTLSGAMLIGLNIGGRPDSLIVPLSDDVARLAALGGLVALKLILIGLYCWRGLTSMTLLVGALSVFLSWVAMYSATGAFVPQVVFNCLLMAVILRPNVSKENRRAWAAGFLSIVFTLAALQKINVQYLAGHEFVSPNGFIAPFQYHFGPLPQWLAIDVLPKLSIVVELIIGVGVLFRPKFFSQLSVFFILSLLLIYPNLALPYMTVAALSLLIYPESAGVFANHLPRFKLDSVFPWFFILIAFSTVRNWIGRGWLEFYLIPWFFSIAFFWLQTRVFLAGLRAGHFHEDSVFSFGNFSFSRNIFAAVLLLTMVLMPEAYRNGAPGPIGFSMFSAQRGRGSSHNLNVQSESACLDLERNLVILITVDVRFQRNKSTCQVSASTASGLMNLKREICRRFGPHAVNYDPNLRVGSDPCPQS